MRSKKLIFCLLMIFISSEILVAEDIVIISKIIINGNAVTRERVILRELTFLSGDTIILSEIAERLNRSQENLLNTSLFNFVTITREEPTTGYTNILISVEERWYIWPSVILKYDDRNFSAWLKAGDLSRSLYGVSIDWYNCFGRKETLKISILSGFANQFTLSYKYIALDRYRKHFAGADIELSRRDEIIFKTKNNEPVTFDNSFKTVYERQKYTLNYLYRPFIRERHNFYLNFVKYSVADTIIKQNPYFLFDGQTKLNCFTIDYVYTYDSRDLKAYPLKGTFFEVLAGQTISFSPPGKRLSSTVLIPSLYKYFEINERFHFATGFNLKFSFTNRQSYLYSRSLGYLYNMHGFEYNTIEGQHFLLIKNLFKVTLLNPRISELRFIPLHKFNKIHYALYFNVFNDLGYVYDNNKLPDNTYSDKFLASVGAGLDLVTYYDRTFRFEYSVNGFGKSGFFLHLTAPLNK